MIQSGLGWGTLAIIISILLSGIVGYRRIKRKYIRTIVVPTHRRKHGLIWSERIVAGGIVVFGLVTIMDVRLQRGERINRQPQTIIQFMIDVSLSMSAKDVQPTRFALARNFLIDLLDDLSSYPVGVIIYSQIGFPWIPVSTETAAVQERLRSTTLRDFPPLSEFVGTNIGDAIIYAIDRMINEPGDYTRGAIVLITDGENNIGPALQQAADYANEREIPIFVFAVGSDTYYIGTSRPRQEDGFLIPGQRIDVPPPTTGLDPLVESTNGFLYRIYDEEDFLDARESVVRTIRRNDRIETVPYYIAISYYTGRITLFLLFLAVLYRIIILVAGNRITMLE